MTQGNLLPDNILPQESPKWFTSGVRGIGIASFLADTGHEVPTALFASLVVSVLGASAAVLGLIEGLADGLAGLARLLGGPLADDPNQRRTTALGGYLSTAALAALIGVAGAVWQIALLRMAAWAARGLRVPARGYGPHRSLRASLRLRAHDGQSGCGCRATPGARIGGARGRAHRHCSLGRSRTRSRAGHFIRDPPPSTCHESRAQVVAHHRSSAPAWPPGPDPG